MYLLIFSLTFCETGMLNLYPNNSSQRSKLKPLFIPKFSKSIDANTTTSACIATTGEGFLILNSFSDVSTTAFSVRLAFLIDFPIETLSFVRSRILASFGFDASAGITHIFPNLNAPGILLVTQRF